MNESPQRAQADDPAAARAAPAERDASAEGDASAGRAGLGPIAAPLLRTAQEWAGLIDRLLRRELGLTLAQYRLLSLLAEAGPEGWEPWQLAQELGLASSRTTTVLDALEQLELIRRAPHPTDGRRRLVALTARGETAVRYAAPAVAAAESQVLSGLSDEQREALAGSLDRLQELVLGFRISETRGWFGP